MFNDGWTIIIQIIIFYEQKLLKSVGGHLPTKLLDASMIIDLTKVCKWFC